ALARARRAASHKGFSGCCEIAPGTVNALDRLRNPSQDSATCSSNHISGGAPVLWTRQRPATTGEPRPMTATVLMLSGVVLSLAVAVGLWMLRPARPSACVLAAARAATINAKLRLRTLNLTPEEMGIAVPDTGVWGAVADMGFPNGTAIVVAFSDGS